VLESLGLFLGELARFDQLVDERLIARDLRQIAVSEDVGSAVADLSEKQPIVDQSGDRRRRAHATPRAIGPGFTEDAHAGVLDRAHQAPRQIFPVARRLGLGEAIIDDVDRESARHLARSGATHAVANAEYGARLAEHVGLAGLELARLAGQVRDEEVVLVVLTHLPDICLAEDSHLDDGGLLFSRCDLAHGYH
jgi:hypothetical protein